MTQIDRRELLKRGGGFAAAFVLPSWPLVARPRGLVGDGVADDTAALRRAIAEGANELRLPAGTYRVTGPISIDRPMCIRGDGSSSTVILHDGVAPRDTLEVRAAGVRLVGLHIDGTGATAQSGVYALRVTGSGFVGSGLHVSGNDGTIVANTHSARWERCTSSIWIYRSPDCVVEKCNVTGSRHTPCIALVSDGSHGAAVRGSSFTGRPGSLTRVCAVHVRGSDDVVVSGNRIGSSEWYGILVEQSARARVRANVVTRPGRLQPDGGPTVTGIELVEAPGSLVVENRVRKCGGYGIAVARCVSAEAQPVRVERNSVAECGDPGLTVQRSRAVRLEGNSVTAVSWGFTIGEDNAVCQHVVVTGNRFRDCPYGGGYVRGSSHCAVTRNSFTACGDDPRVENRGDAVIVLWDATRKRGVTATAVTDNTAAARRAPWGGDTPAVPLSRFVRSGGSMAFPSRHARGLKVRRNRFVV